MLSDWSWSDYDLRLMEDKPRLRPEHGRGLLADVDYPRTLSGVDESKSRIDRGLKADAHWPWTMRGCGLIPDAVAVVDRTGPRTDCGLVADKDWP